MKIKNKKFKKEEKATGKITNSWAMIKGFSKFSNYEYNNGFMLLAKTPVEFDSFYNKTDVLNSIKNLGKYFYKISKPILIANYRKNSTKNSTTNSSSLTFLDLSKNNSNENNNSIIKNFLPINVFNEIFLDEKLKKNMSDKLLNFCEQNGFPLIDDNNSFDIDNTSNVGYFFNIIDFISMSILIYIIFEVQHNINQILNTFISDNTKSKKIGKICDMFSSDDQSPIKDYYCIEEELNILLEFIWFFDIELENKSELNLLELSQKLTTKFNEIEYNTSYLNFNKELQFYPDYLKFTILEIHSNLISIAWEKLKIVMLSQYNSANQSYDESKICKNCGSVFETSDSSCAYCFNCLDYRPNINSKNSYKKMCNLHNSLKDLFNSLTETQLNLLQKEDLENIILYKNLTISSLKGLQGNKIENLEKYINLLKNIK